MKTHIGISKWSMIFGILSIVCGIFTGIPAIVMGHKALRRDQNRIKTRERTYALIGLVLGYISSLYTIIHYSYLYYSGYPIVDSILKAFTHSS